MVVIVQPHERKNPLGDECSNSAITDTQCSLIAALPSSPKIHMITQWTHSRICFLPVSCPKYCIKNPGHSTNKLKMFENSKRTFLFPSTPRFPQIPSLSPQFVFRQAVAEAAHQLFQAFGRSQEAKNTKIHNCPAGNI